MLFYKTLKNCSFFLLLAAFIGSMLFYSSCANMGSGPQGGLKDSIPPVAIRSIPEYGALNFEGKQFTVLFNEYIVPDKLNDKLVISPPLAKRPSIKTKGKSIIITIEEELIPGRTYSVDFKDGIKDYNEGNKMESLRLLFSTFDQLDTLQISGKVFDANNLEPIENVVVTAYSINHDSVFTTTRPDFIAKTNAEGYYLFDNLPAGEYRIYALTDGDNNLFYSQETEKIAFVDSLLVPTAQYINKVDTFLVDGDTLVSNGYTLYSPENIDLLLFIEDYYNQYLSGSKRPARDKMEFIFSEGVTDSFNISILKIENDNTWKYQEISENRDSISIWIIDTLVAEIDTFDVRVTYTALDTANQMISFADTLQMVFNDDVKNNAKSKKKDNDEEDAQPVQPTFQFKTNLKSKDFDMDKKILIESPTPTEVLQKEFVHLEQVVNDSTRNPIEFELQQQENSMRKYIISYKPMSETGYMLSIDSGVVHTPKLIPNKQLETKFATRNIEFYGTLTLNISGIKGAKLIQILKNSKDENLVKQVSMDEKATSIKIPFLHPGEYRVKLIVDQNENGIWDSGNYENKIAPEAVYYFEKYIEIKENWDYTENWSIVPGKIQIKDYVKEEDKEKNKGKNQF